VAGSIFLLLPWGLQAQESSSRLSGQVTVDGEGVASVEVVLHRVTTEESGPIDTTRTDGGGRFAFTLPRAPDASAGHEVFFAAVDVDGILYFGPPLSVAAQLDSLYVVEAYRTEVVGEAPPGLPLSLRNIFMEENPSGGWVVTDLFQIVNRGDRTWVSAEGRPVWTYPLPDGAQGFEVGQGDIAPDAVRLDGNRILVTAPIPPGDRMLVVRYRLAERDAVFQAPGITERFEILVREPVPDLQVSGLVPQGPVQMSPGQVYRHFLGEQVSETIITLEAGAPPIEGIPAEWLAVILALALAAAGIVAYHRGRQTPGVPAMAGGGPTAMEGPGMSPRQALLLRIAELDEAYARNPSPTEQEEREYQELRGQLADLLLSEEG
jgi:hypothetical protein